MSAFTRGPWKRSELFTGGIYVTSKDGVIADVRPIEDGVGEANALLIAAAPELVDALRESIDLIKSWHGPEAWDIYYEHSPEMKRLRAALAKACPP